MGIEGENNQTICDSSTKCYYCGRTAQDLLDENVFDPRLYDTDNESKTNCFLCSEHGMYNMVDHIKDPVKKEECLKRFSINHPYIDERNKKTVEAIKKARKAKIWPRKSS